jgi:alpha-N-arabinofuranosidase
MDGPWQIGHKTAEEYGRLAQETGKAMKRLDPAIELVACGSSNSGMPTFGAWESTVLEHCFDEVDYISAHAYYEQHGDDLVSYLASAVDMDRFIEAVTATADAVAARRRSRRRLRVSFDEWNVWYQNEFDGESSLELRAAPEIIEDDYSATDAVVVGGLLVSLLKHADRVGVACLAQLVNVIAPIRTKPGGLAWRQSIFHPFALTAAAAHGTVLRAAIESPSIGTAQFGEIPVLDAVAVVNDVDGQVAVFAVNRSPRERVHLDVALQHLGEPQSATVETLALGGVRLTGDVQPPATTRVPVDGRHVALDLPAGSWSRCLIRL